MQTCLIKFREVNTIRGCLTWMGVPDRMTLKLAASCLMALESLVFPFLMT